MQHERENLIHVVAHKIWKMLLDQPAQYQPNYIWPEEKKEIKSENVTQCTLGGLICLLGLELLIHLPVQLTHVDLGLKMSAAQMSSSYF